MRDGDVVLVYRHEDGRKYLACYRDDVDGGWFLYFGTSWGDKIGEVDVLYVYDLYPR